MSEILAYVGQRRDAAGQIFVMTSHPKCERIPRIDGDTLIGKYTHWL